MHAVKLILSRRICAIVFSLILYIIPAAAWACSSATSQGTAPAGWETYCWLDFTSYNDAAARSATGQPFSLTLADGTVLSFTLKTSPGAAAAFEAKASPSWTGSAVGNTAFLGIPGKPILYTLSGGTKVIEFSNITVTPPIGSAAITSFAFVAADAESTNNGESLQFVTNGGAWTILDQVDPISGNLYPAISGTNTNTFTETGVAGTVGGYIVASNSPTTVTTNVVAGGLQGAMFAVRFASMRVSKNIVGARINAADQFNFKVTSTASGATLASGITSGTGNGPFNASAISLASGLQLSLSESMAAGSISALTKYRGTLTCTNSTIGSSTAVPVNLVTSSYNFGSLQFGDAIQCTFTNTAFPHLQLRKALSATGRRFAGDQFTVRILDGATPVATSTTAGSLAVLTGGDTGQTQVTPGTAYTLDEIAAASGSLSQYSSVMSCTNAANGITTSFPSASPGIITPQLGDVITCTITNTAMPANATLVVAKTSVILSDGISSANPKAIPGAVVRYTITVSNTGNLPVDASTIVIFDPLPANFTFDASAPVTFTNGANPSGLNAFNQSNMVTYSAQANGGAPFTAPLGSGYNAAIKGLRIAPTGIMAAATNAGPTSFSISFNGRLN